MLKERSTSWLKARRKKGNYEKKNNWPHCFIISHKTGQAVFEITSKFPWNTRAASGNMTGRGSSAASCGQTLADLGYPPRLMTVIGNNLHQPGRLMRLFKLHFAGAQGSAGCSTFHLDHGESIAGQSSKKSGLTGELHRRHAPAVPEPGGLVDAAGIDRN